MKRVSSVGYHAITGPMFGIMRIMYRTNIYVNVAGVDLEVYRYSRYIRGRVEPGACLSLSGALRRLLSMLSLTVIGHSLDTQASQ